MKGLFYFSELIPEQTFNMELIVQCVRSSINPQTHHQALLVLTVAAELYPVSFLSEALFKSNFFEMLNININFSHLTMIIKSLMEELMIATDIRALMINSSSP